MDKQQYNGHENTNAAYERNDNKAEYEDANRNIADDVSSLFHSSACTGFPSMVP